MKKIKYERTWADYLTPCPYGKNDTQVGSHECVRECKYCVTWEEKKPKKYEIGDYRRYTDITEGYVMCQIEDKP